MQTSAQRTVLDRPWKQCVSSGLTANQTICLERDSLFRFPHHIDYFCHTIITRLLSTHVTISDMIASIQTQFSHPQFPLV